MGRRFVEYEKYSHTKYDIHTVDETGKVVVKDAEEIERQNRNKEICLNCKKKKCTGTNLCFEKERKLRND